MVPRSRLRVTASDRNERLGVMSVKVAVVAPTMVEYLAARLVIRGHRVWKSGMGRAETAKTFGAPVVLCGLAGGLDPELVVGSVVVSETVAGEEGVPTACDPDLVAALIEGGERLGHEVHTVPMLTVAHLVTGTEREMWTGRGFGAVDMESALWARGGRRMAALRVVLDTREHPLSREWLHPGRALRLPRLWVEMAGIGSRAIPYALRAARIVAEALDVLAERDG